MLMWLRAAGLVGQSLTLGGAAFASIVFRFTRGASAHELGRTLTLCQVGALLVAGAQLGVLACLSAAFADESGWAGGLVLASTVGAVGLTRIALALAALAAAPALRRAPGASAGQTVLVAAAALLPVTSALISHATGRPDGGAWLVALGAVHQAAVGTWVGGLACAVVLGARGERDDGVWLRRFSALATGAVGVVAVTGIALALAFVRTPGAAIGTAYGAMVLTKIALFGALLVMGALNHRAVHRAAPSATGPASALVLRRRLEVEAGLAMVTIFLAASISSAPPAIDVADRVSAEEIRGVLTPRWPRLQSPSLVELAAASALTDPLSPRTPENTAWSEFGHNVSGLFILAMGVLATLEQTGRARWARHWPLILIGLTGFVAYSVDPEGWQTGLVGFWEHLLDPEVLQHRILLALTALFGLGEWRLRQGRRPDSPWRYVFPVVCIASGALLISHTHLVSDVRSAFFMELSHLVLGLVSLAVGWARWLEIRLPPAEGRAAGRLWGPALAVFGLLLIFYREA